MIGLWATESAVYEHCAPHLRRAGIVAMPRVVLSARNWLTHENLLLLEHLEWSRPGGAQKSTGLGLNFVKEAVELHGGTVSIERDGARTRARIRLPR